jgi:hypothetical protein
MECGRREYAANSGRVFPDGISAGRGHELQRAQPDEMQRHELLDGGQGVGSAVRP